MKSPRLTFRSRIVALVLTVGLIPLVVLGFWLSGTGRRAGEQLLRERLQQSLDAAAREVGLKWIQQRSVLLDAGAAEQAADAAGKSTMAVSLPVWQDLDAVEPDSWIDARVDAAALLPLRARAYGLGIGVGMFDRSGATLIPPPIPVDPVGPPRIRWAGEDWLVATRRLDDPAVTLIAAAPLDPLIVPFRSAARRGFALVAFAGLAGLTAALLLTGAMTRSLTQLVGAADSLRRGDLQRRVRPRGRDEVAELGRAFDAMADSIQDASEQLSQRESLAAVGRFASELAHEVRNPLTSIMLDLQYVHEQLPEGSEGRGVQQGVISEVQRLERTVSAALQIARSGTVERNRIDLRDVLQSAVYAARGHLAARGARVHGAETLPSLPLYGDADALQRLFLNLLCNAAQAVCTGGRVTLSVRTDGCEVVVTLDDDGPGIDAALAEKLREPFFTTRPDGTGLGLAVADRVVTAHGGSLTLQTRDGGGARAVVVLPT